MHFTSSIVALVLTFVGFALAQEGVITPGAQGTPVGGALDPTDTPAPKGPKPAAAQIAGPLTIHVTNSFGAGLSISYGHDAGSPTAINNPQPGPLGDA
jgi:hypothetical protein